MKEKFMELTVHGQKRTFSKKEMETFLERHIPKEQILSSNFKIELTVHGQTETFSKNGMEAFLEKHIPKEQILSSTFNLAEKPTMGKCFKVVLKEINMSYFLEKRDNERQEITRKYILEAFIEALKKPERYKYFYLLRPRIEWIYGEEEDTSLEEQMSFAKKLEGHTTILTEEVLGWAQQISNGNGTDEAWESLCNKQDSEMLSRLIIGKNSKIMRCGGRESKRYEAMIQLHYELFGEYELDEKGLEKFSSSSLYGLDNNPNQRLNDTIPSVTLTTLYCGLFAF